MCEVGSSGEIRLRSDWQQENQALGAGKSTLWDGEPCIPFNVHQKLQIYRPYCVVLAHAEFHGV